MAYGDTSIFNNSPPRPLCVRTGGVEDVRCGGIYPEGSSVKLLLT